MKSWGTVLFNRIGIEVGASWRGWGYKTLQHGEVTIPIGISLETIEFLLEKLENGAGIDPDELKEIEERLWDYESALQDRDEEISQLEREIRYLEQQLAKESHSNPFKP